MLHTLNKTLTHYTKKVTSIVLRKYLHFAQTLNFQTHNIVIYIHFAYLL